MDIHDHLPLLVDGMMDFLKKHAMRSAEFTGLKRRDNWNLPIVLLREAIINAVVHAE